VTSLRRAFVAVVPPAAVLDALEPTVARARASGRAGGPDVVRWTPRAQWHITLRFLGAVADDGVLVGAVRDAVAGMRAPVAALGGSGAFPSAGRASVLWVDVRDGREGIGSLAAAVERGAVAAGMAPEVRPFRPHLTVARLRAPSPVHELLDAIGTEPIGPAWSVDALVLFDSETRPDGAVHHAVGRFPLAGPAT
jgi:2'-5' RNA ligase